jgi:YidC/Oxa1 family membrane protein insertase
MSIFAAFGAVVGVAHSAIEGLAVLLTPVAGGVAAALAIVLFTLAVRALISPLTYVQVRAERRRAALAPQVEKLRKKHKNDQVALATATLELHRANGAGPFVGMLPGLAQAPFFMIMYRVALRGPAGSLAGIPLGAHLFAGWPVFAVLIGLALVLAWWSSRRMKQTVTGEPSGLARIMPLFPYLTVLAVAYLPLAGALYLVTSTSWTALEHAVWRRPVKTGSA